MAISKEKHRQDIQQFAKEDTVYKTFADILNQVLVKASKLYAPFAIVQTRPKSVSSFAEKIIRKNKYKDPLKDITDLCGARIITQTQQQVGRICQFIKENFQIDETNSLDVSERLHVSEFGYRSVHFVVTPTADEILDVKIPDELKDKKAEIQVRTLLQHTWADVIHDRLYKTTLKVPKEWERESARLAALLENADENVARLTSLIDSYTANYGNSMNRETLDNEIETLKVILENEPVEINKPLFALRIARLAKFPGDWDLVIDILSKYVNVECKAQSEIKMELGFALCKKYSDTPKGIHFKKGLKYIMNIAKPNETIPEYRLDVHEASTEGMKLRILALQYMAEVMNGLEKDEVIKRMYNLAYELNPGNPYLFAKLLEYNSRFCKNKILIRENIVKAIQSCYADIHLRIESLKAYFTIGRLCLILQDSDKALNVYLKVVDLCISNKICVARDIFEIEINSLERLKSSVEANPTIDWIRTILLMASYIKYSDIKSFNIMKKNNIKQKAFQSPVVIVAGGADSLIKSSAIKYGSYIIEAVKKYEGTILSGGTTSGVPGLLGTAVDFARKNGNKKIELIGYIPRSISKETKIDKAYKVVKTIGREFSPLESIQMWRDLIISGVHPNDVRVLGIDGGSIANIEYRLALSLGAHVGLVNESGHAAVELLKDDEWCNHENLHVIPNETESVWTFLNHKIRSVLTSKQLEDTAKVIHENYVKEQIELERDELNLKPWDTLSSDLKDSNINQAIFICELLSSVGYGIRKPQKDGKEVKSFHKDDIIKMSRMEHGRFVVERLMKGWKYGPQKDIEKKISPYLISWDDLTEEVKQYDFDAIVNFPKLLEAAGYEIYKMEND